MRPTRRVARIWRTARRWGRAALGSALALGAFAPGAASAEAADQTRASLAALVEVSDIEALAASPNGRLVAYRVHRASLARNSYTLEWHVADLTTGATRRVADGGAPIYNDGLIEGEPPVWSPDGRFLYFRSLVGDAIGVWRAAADGSGGALVVGGDADIESLSASQDGAALSYVTGPTRAAIVAAELREYDDGILVDASVDMAQTLFRGGFVHGRLASQRLIGRWYSRDGLLWRAPRTRHRLDLATLAPGPTEPVAAPSVEAMSATTRSPALTAIARSGAIATASGPQLERTLEARDADGTRRVCASVACRGAPIVALAWRPNAAEVVFTTRDRHYRQSLYAWTVRTGRVRLLVRGAGLLTGGRLPHLPCAMAATGAVCVAAGGASPPRLEYIPFDGGVTTVLADPNAALRGRFEARTEYLEWRLADGRVASATIFIPTNLGGRRAPLFLTYYYCDGFLRGGVGDEFPLLPMAEAGFVVGCLNTVPFRDWGDGVDRYRAAQASVEGLIPRLERRGLIDPTRIGMGGFSAGSEAAMWIAMNTRLLAAAAIASPPYEPSAYWMGAMRGRDNPKVMREFMQAGAPDEDPERWRTIAPALNVERITAPLLIQLPAQEIRHSAELYARLSNTRTPVEMFAFVDEAHVRLQPRHRLAAYRRDLDWFRYWLDNRVDPDPARAEQYRRWDALRRRQGSAAE